MSDGRSQFSVKMAYRLAKDWKGDERWEGWRRIWKLGARQQVEVFVADDAW